MSESKKTYIKTEGIDGFSITYEREEGFIFATGECPICGRVEESIQDVLDPGPITVSKIKTHMQLSHKASN